MKLLFYLKDVKVTEKLYPLNLSSVLKCKISLSFFYSLNFNFNADFQNFNAEIPFTLSCQGHLLTFILDAPDSVFLSSPLNILRLIETKLHVEPCFVG